MGQKTGDKEKRIMYRVINSNGDYTQILPETSADQVKFNDGEDLETKLPELGKVDELKLNSVEITPDANKVLNVATDGTYNASTNKLATVSTVSDAISDLTGSATIASKSGDVVTLKAGITESNGVIANNSSSDISLGTAAVKNYLTGTSLTDSANLPTATQVKTYVDNGLLAKVDANAEITSGTHTKITYDAKGLVTGGSDLTASDIPDLSSTYVNVSQKGANSGVASLDTNGKIPTDQLPDSILGQLKYIGPFDASAGTGGITPYEKGNYYISHTMGMKNPDGTTSLETYNIGDWAVSKGAGLGWDRIPNMDAVASVNGKTGSVVLAGTDILVSGTTGNTIAQEFSSVNSTISSHTSSITTLQSSVALNTTNIATNTGDITTLKGYFTSGKANDADKLDGHDSSYFLDASNFTNLPEITVGTPTGSGNAITAISVDATDKHKINVVRGATFLEGNETITLSGAITGSGTTAITTTLSDGAVGTAKIADGAVTTAKLAVPTSSALPQSFDSNGYSAVHVNSKGQVTGVGYSVEFGTALSNTPSSSLMINGLFFELVE